MEFITINKKTMLLGETFSCKESDLLNYYNPDEERLYYSIGVEAMMKIREKRNKFLNDIDLKYCNAECWSKMAEEEKTKWSNYKQALRDVTDNITKDNFEIFVWPTFE